MVELLLYIGVVFLLARKSISWSSAHRKKLKFFYFVPLIVYIIVAAVFARQIIEFVGPCQIEVLMGPVGNTLVYWVYPSLNIIFFVTYFLTVLFLLTHWEPVVKYSENSPFLVPLVVFWVINIISILRVDRHIFSKVVPPWVCWVLLMSITAILGIILVKHDLKRDFRKIVSKRKKNRQVEADRGKKKVLFIYPVSQLASGLSIRSYTTFPPLSLGILAALTPRDKFYVELIDEQFDAFVYQEADLVAITAFTTYAPRAYDIARVYREKGIPVVMGGIHASMMTDEALRYVDSVVVGEAENIWPTVLEDFLSNGLKSVYQGTYADLDNMVIPDRDIFDDRYVTSSIQTSRGCPWNCKYCSVAAFNGRRYRQRPVEEILDELETIPNRYVFFVDDNLIGYSRAAERRALALFKGMVKRKMRKRWLTQTTIDIGTKPELLKWAAKSGCIFLFIGLEFIDKEQLQGMDKEVAINIDYTQALKNINRHGIGVIGAFIYGSDDETREKMFARAAFIIRNRIDVMQQSKLTAFPGTRIFHQLKNENRIIYTDYPRDWEKYDFYELTHIPLGMKREEFIRYFRQCVSKTYSLPVIWMKGMRTLLHTRNFETAAGSMRANFSYRALSFYHMRKQRQQETPTDGQ